MVTAFEGRARQLYGAGGKAKESQPRGAVLQE
jgi:hypothetical protein